MKWIKLYLLLLLGCISVLQAQTPSLTINPGGTTSVCAGSSLTINSSITNAFAGTDSYAVSNITFSPYTIMGGNSVTMVDDQMSMPLPIGFQFCFFGNTYTQFYIGSNGWVGFSPGQTIAFTANPIPNSGVFVPRNCIMGPWMDWNPGVGTGSPYIRYQTQGIAPYRRLIVQWTNCPLYQCTASSGTFQIVLYESTNIIENFITSKPVCAVWAGGTATQGLHNLTGTVAVTVAGRNAAVWTANNDGKRFTPNGPPNYTINWTSNAFPIGTGNSVTTTINGPGITRIIARANFLCSNLILYDTLDVSIGGTANASFTTPPVICAGQPANFNYTGGVTGTGTWTFTSGTPATASGLGTQSTTWNTPGTYNVSLTVAPTSGLCLPGTSSQTVNVVAPPNSNFTLPASVCMGSTAAAVFAGSAPPGSTYAWNFGSGASPATAATGGPHNVSWSTTGIKTVTLTVTSGACSSTTTRTINVVNAPTSGFTATPSTVCAGSPVTVTFTGSAGGGASYNWNFGAGASPASATTAGPHAVSWSSAGSKTISLSVSEGGCTSAVTSQTVNVTAIPTASFTLPASVCVGNAASITYTGSASAPPLATYTWNVNGGTPAPANTQGPLSISWSTPGVKNISLSVSQNGCTSAAVSQSITVNSLPVVSIVASSAAVCTGNSIGYSISSGPLAPGTSCNWNFGAGASPATSSSAGPVAVTYSTPGTKTASLTITSGGCTSAPASVNVVVQDPPLAAFSMPSTACLGAPVSINAPGPFLPGTTFNWNFGGGTVISGSGAGPYQVSWPSAATTTVSLQVSYAGCTASYSQLIDVRSGPTATFSVPSPACVGASLLVTYTGNGTTSDTYNWNFGAGASPATATGIGPHSVSYSSAGSKTISLSMSSGACTIPIQTQMVTINAIPSAGILTPSPVCAGNPVSVSLSGAAQPGTNYTWNFGTGASPATGTGAGPHLVSWTSAGSPSISLTASAGGCTSTATQVLTVNTGALASISAPAIAGQGVPASIGISGPAQAGATYSWNFGAGASPATTTGAGPHNVTFSATGTPSIILTTSYNGCINSSNQSIAVVAAVTSSFSTNANLCLGSNATITYTGNATAMATYTWNFDGGTANPGTGPGPHLVSWATPGVKNISLNVTEAGFTSTVTNQVVTVHSSPSSSFTVPATACSGNSVAVNYTGNAGPGALYSWNFGSGSSPSSATGQGPHSVTYAGAGVATISLQVTENGCVSGTSTHTVSVQNPPTALFTLPVNACAGAPIAIQLSNPVLPGVTYNWNFGAGASIGTATGSGPHLVSWINPGTAAVSLFASSGSCVSTPVLQNMQILPSPTATFTLSSPVCQSDVVTLNYTGNALSGATFNWVYPSGAWVSGSGSGPLELTYPSGNHTIELQVEENGCLSAIGSEALHVQAPVNASISSPQYAGAGSSVSVNYTGDTPAGATYTWDFQGATIISGSGQGPYQISWPSAGIYTITCVVDDGICPPITATAATEVLSNAVATFTAQSPVCENEVSNILFTGSSLPGSTYSWDFDGGTIVSGSADGPFEIEWNSPGLKTISLIITQMGIPSPVMTQQVLVNAIPTASFSLPSTFCEGSNALLTYTGNASPTATYNWDFGSGTLVMSNPGQQYTVSFPVEGSSQVGLTVIENGCISTSVVEQIFVQETPSAMFTAGLSICEGGTIQVQYTGVADPGTNFNWNFGSGNIINGSASGPFTIEYSQAGTESISLITSYGGCSSAQENHDVNVLSVPEASFLLSGSACAGDTLSVLFTGSASSSANFTWDFEATVFSEGSAQGPYQIVFPAAGTWPLGLYIEDNGCNSLIETQNFEVYPSPLASFTMSDTIFVGQEALIDFTGQSPAGTSVVWDYPSANFISGSPDSELILEYPTAGTYSVSLEMMLGACTDGPISQDIVVLPIPVSSFSISADTVCAGTPVTVTYSGITNSQTQFNWDFAGAEVISGSGAGPYELVWNSGTVAEIALYLSIDNFNTDTSVALVQITGIPVASFSMPEQMCAGDTIQAVYNQITTLNASFVWDNANADYEDFSDAASPYFSWNTAGIKQVMLSIADGMCISEPVIHEITVNDIPSASFDLPAYACDGTPVDISFDGSAGSTASFSWYFDGGEVVSGSAAGPFEVIWQAGEKQISLAVIENGCVSDTFHASITVRSLPFADAGLSVQVCSGDSVQLNAFDMPGYSYQWITSNGLSNDTIYNPMLSMQSMHNYLEQTVLSLEVSDQYCENTDTVSVFVAPVPVASYIVPADQCFEGNSFNFINNGSYTEAAVFSWNLGPHAYSHTPGEEHQNAIQFDVEGTQAVSLVITQFGCTSLPFVDSVRVNPHPSASFDVDGIKGCIPLRSSFTALPAAGSDNLTYDWSFGDGQSGSGPNPEHTYLQSGYFGVTLTASNEFGCSFTETQASLIQVLEQPVAGFRTTPETVFIGGDEMEIISFAENAQFCYYVIENDTILGYTNSYTFTEEGVYEITQVVVNAAGCSDSISHSVVVEYGTEYYIPSAFTPNNDGHNEVFKVVGENIRKFSLTIFDRWGSEIFHTQDVNEGWDGKTANDEVLPPGVYVYRLEMRSNTNRDIIKSGEITLLR